MFYQIKRKKGSTKTSYLNKVCTSPLLSMSSKLIITRFEKVYYINYSVNKKLPNFTNYFYKILFNVFTTSNSPLELEFKLKYKDLPPCCCQSLKF